MSAAAPARDVLIVEDSDEDHDTALEALGGTGLAVRTWRAENGERCLHLLAGDVRRPPLRPALILLDLNTHGIGGRETLRAIRQDAALRAVPVVVLTTSSNPRDIALCYALGANAYHVKPFDYPEHLGALRALFDYWLRRATLPAHDGP